MPGIVGIISKHGPSTEWRSMIHSMVKCMTHEAFYMSGTYINEELGLSSGWACHKGEFGDCLPIWHEKKVVLFNDRYGVNRIYYHEDASGFYFSSEAKALLRVLPGTRQLDLRSLGEVICCEAVLQNRSLFSGISLLPPGSAWVFSRGEPVKKHTYCI